jgi:hypothetical protein
LKNVLKARKAGNFCRPANRLVWLLGCLVVATGCQNGPITGRMQQNRLENERLLSEFRSQQKEVEQLRADRSRLLQQQAETEKLAARLQAQLNGRREGSDTGSSGRLAERANPQPTRMAQGSRDRSYESDRNLDRASSSSLQWRPIRKAGE